VWAIASIHEKPDDLWPLLGAILKGVKKALALVAYALAQATRIRTALRLYCWPHGVPLSAPNLTPAALAASLSMLLPFGRSRFGGGRGASRSCGKSAYIWHYGAYTGNFRLKIFVERALGIEVRT
jgi:hypothetical protein